MQRRCGVNRIWTAARRRLTGRTVKDIQTTQKRRVRKKRWCHPNLRTNRFEISDKSFCGLYKCLGKLFGVCGSPASLSRNFLAFAGVPQEPRKTFWLSRGFRRNSLLGCRTLVIDRLVRQEYPTGRKGLSRLIMLSVGPMEDFSTCGFGTVSLGLTPIASPVGRMELFLLLRPDLQNRKTVR